MKKNKLYLCEKPSSAMSFNFLLSEGDLIIIACGTASYKFDYQNVSFSEAPYTNEIPQYKAHDENKVTPLTISAWNSKERFEIETFINIVNLNKDKVKNKLKIDLITNEFLDNFDEIIFACDSDITGVRAFCFKFEKFFNLGENWKEKLRNKKIQISAINYSSLDKNSILKYNLEKTDLNDNEIFNILENSFIKKDFFEYNYNLNSILFFNDALSLPNHFKEQYDFILTKNYILTLFLIKDKKSICSDYLHTTMKDIGNLISHHTIIDNLLKIGLIREDRNNPLESKFDSLHYPYEITNIGKGFIKNLHKKVNDPHLGKRLKKDNIDNHYGCKDSNGLTVNDFKIKYEKYLYAVFSRQKRFIRKIKRS